MPIIKTEEWNKCKEVNDDPYGGCVVKVAEKAMEILDRDQGEIDAHSLFTKADDESNAGGITGFMAGAAANIISQVHSRGDEFRKAWNKSYGVDETKANGGTVNPAIVTIG